MRWGLQWWNLITIVSTSLVAAAEHGQQLTQPIEETIEPVEPIDTIEQIDQLIIPLTTQSSRIPFYEPGTDFLAIPELYRHIKAGKNTSGLYVGPTFSKEFMIKTPSEKRVSTGFKLLDWKRRRKRLDTTDQQVLETNLIKGGTNEVSAINNILESRKGTGMTRDYSSTNKNDMLVDSCMESNRNFEDNTDKKILISSTNDPISGIKTDLKEITESRQNLGKIYTQPPGENRQFHSNERSKLKRTQHNLKYTNETSRRKRCKKRNSRIRKRLKRAEDFPFEDFIEFKRVVRDNPGSRSNNNLTQNTSTTQSLSKTSVARSTSTVAETSQITTEENIKSSAFLSTISSQVDSVTNSIAAIDNNTLITSQNSSRVTKDVNATLIDEREAVSKKERQKFIQAIQNASNQSETKEESVTSKAKAKIIIGGDEMPLHPLSKEQKLALLAIDHVNLLTSHQVPVFAACVTPPPSTTGDTSQDLDTQRADCHPKGSGPLCPITLDPEAYGPRNEEEIEDALTGKLADRVVEVVLAKAGKCPRMIKELGLYAQGNLSSVQSGLIHPEGKEACKQQSSETLKMTVLQEIANAVDKLANTKSSGLCLKPPEDLTEFLSWLLSEDPDLEMPEPCAHLAFQPKREADYLFRSGALPEEIFNEFKDIDQKYNWESWMSFAEDGAEDIEDDSEGKRQLVRVPKNVNRSPRHLAHGNRTVKKIRRKRERHGRRRRYTPWSLIDYP